MKMSLLYVSSSYPLAKYDIIVISRHIIETIHPMYVTTDRAVSIGLSGILELVLGLTSYI